LVPTIQKRWVNGEQRKTIQPVKNPQLLTEFTESFMIRTRLYSDLDYLVGECKFPSVAPKKNRTLKYSKINKVLLIFGLQTTRISSVEEPESNDPFIIHRVDINPFNQVFPHPVVIEEILEEPRTLIKDKRWEEWGGLLKSGLFNPFQQSLKDKQFETIECIMKNPGSLTVAALPTGYGKTRIVQVATYLLRKSHLEEKIRVNEEGDCGPTLIISPLVALMDDQRTKWSVEFSELLEGAGLSKLNCRFLTTADLDRDPVKMQQLRDNKLDVLCCSPEDLMDPKQRRNHWLETFARMKVPFSMMVVDEAHIIGSWGATIRPQFQLLSLVKDRLLQRNSNLRVLLMSATISMSEERELIRLFSSGLHHKLDPNGNSTAIRITEEGTRPDLYIDISFEEEPSPDRMMYNLNSIAESLTDDWNKKSDGSLFRPDGRPSPILIYTPYPEIANNILRPSAINIISDGDKNFVKTYTGRTSPLSRVRRLQDFVENKVHAMIATSAFGMGVDKPDAWIVAYYGMPYSLSDLYQGFGRAARHNDWKQIGYRKSGYCLGVLHGLVRSFKPRMGLALTTERFWDMLNSEESYITENGYIVLDISDNIGEKYWSTIIKSDETIVQTNQDDEVEEEGDKEGSEGQINDIVQQLISTQAISISNKSSSQVRDNFDKTFDEAYGKMKQIKELLSLRLWSIACLQRVGLVEIQGFHPSILLKQNDKSIRLKETLEYQGYPGIIEALDNQGRENIPTPNNLDGSLQKRMVVLKIKQHIGGFDDIKSGISTGLDLLKKRHDEGKEELQKFLKLAKNPDGKGCFRQHFSQTIGLTLEKSCVQQIMINQQEANGKIVMPCSLCRKDKYFIGLGLGPNITMLSTHNILRVIRDGKNYRSQEGTKKKRTHSLIIDRGDRLTEDGDDELLSGDYQLQSATDYDSYSVLCPDSNDKIGKVTMGINNIASIATGIPQRWDIWQFLIAVKNSNQATFSNETD